jgi:hypothetical protein
MRGHAPHFGDSTCKALILSVVAAPCTTRSGSAAPLSGHSSSSSGGILRALKHIFSWCRDTRQRKDVILNNQCRQNRHLGITNFNKFSLPEPPLVDDPFALLFIADHAAMEAAPTMMTSPPVASTKKKRKMSTTMSNLSITELLLFPFCCLDAKGGEEIYLSSYLYVTFVVFIWTWLVRLYLVCVGHVDMVF